MRVVSILLCVTLMTVVNARTLSKISKPKLKLISIQIKTDVLDNPTRKLPEDRRKLGLFPKKNKKFVITLEPYAVRTINPITRRNKALTRKIVFQNKEIEFANELSVTNFTLSKELSQNLNMNVKDEKHALGIDKNNSEKSAEVNDSFAGEDIIPTTVCPDKESVESEEIQMKVYPKKESMALEDIQTTVDSSKESMALEHIQHTTVYPKKKSIELEDTEFHGNNTEQKQLLEADNAKLSYEDGQIADRKEFMFLNPNKQDIDGSNEDLDELITTTEETVPRAKRSDNVIEEENLGTTVSGYKYTWRDTKLTNNLVFKNINS